MKKLYEVEISRYDWNSLEVMGDRSAAVPASLRGLIEAQDEDTAHCHYWDLENVVVVQGQLFEAAPAVVSVLLAALASGITSDARASVVELIYQIVSGESDEEAIARGHVDIGDQCRSRAREGLWLIYREATRKAANSAWDILEIIEADKTRMSV